MGFFGCIGLIGVVLHWRGEMDSVLGETGYTIAI
jgi:hypothetical protein